MQAGYETSSNCLMFAMCELARRPDIVEKLYEEVVSVCGGTTGDVTWEHVHAMKYENY